MKTADGDAKLFGYSGKAGGVRAHIVAAGCHFCGCLVYAADVFRNFVRNA